MRHGRKNRKASSFTDMLCEDPYNCAIAVRNILKENNGMDRCRNCGNQDKYADFCNLIHRLLSFCILLYPKYEKNQKVIANHLIQQYH
jgi:hypothetical protein